MPVQAPNPYSLHIACVLALHMATWVVNLNAFSLLLLPYCQSLCLPLTSPSVLGPLSRNRYCLRLQRQSGDFSLTTYHVPTLRSACGLGSSSRALLTSMRRYTWTLSLSPLGSSQCDEENIWFSGNLRSNGVQLCPPYFKWFSRERLWRGRRGRSPTSAP